jgi:hypothetical protein
MVSWAPIRPGAKFHDIPFTVGTAGPDLSLGRDGAFQRVQARRKDTAEIHGAD